MSGQRDTFSVHGEHVDLDRHFHLFTQKELADPDLLAAYNEGYGWSGSLSWKELLDRKRTVVLASAGSGKTHEMRQQQRHLADAGKFAFYVQLEALENERFEELLLPNDLHRFQEWRADAQATAWFFLDAVDELKLTQGKLEHALRKMRQATANHVGRPMAILIDGVVVMAPVLRVRISTSAVISGDLTQAEAERIVNGISIR